MIGWVRVDAAIGDDPKIGTIAEALGCDEPKTIGHLVLLWAKMANHARDGRLAPHSDLTLERWAGWTGKRGRFAAAIRTQLCREDGIMRAWERHNGAPMRKAEADAERLRNLRSGATPPATVGATVAPFVAPPVGATVGACVASTDVRTDERPSSSRSKRDRARRAAGAAGPSGARAAAPSAPAPISGLPALRDIAPAAGLQPPEAEVPVDPTKASEVEANRQRWLASLRGAPTSPAPEAAHG